MPRVSNIIKNNNNIISRVYRTGNIRRLPNQLNNNILNTSRSRQFHSSRATYSASSNTPTTTATPKTPVLTKMFGLTSTFHPDQDIPSLAGRVFLVTGGTSGLGLGTVEALAPHYPEHLYIMARNAKKSAAVINDLKAKNPGLNASFIQCDMERLSSVQAAAKAFLAQSSRLDVLICNAGIMAQAPAVTQDGYEIQFQVNHIGHALLIKLLLPLMLNTAKQPNADVRIVNLSSQAHRQTPVKGIEFETLHTDQACLGASLEMMGRWNRYGQSKLANMLYADALAKHYPSILSVSVHPGYILDTGITTGIPLLTAIPAYILSIGRSVKKEEGAHTQLWAATAPRSSMVNGGFYEPFGVPGKRATKASNSPELAEQLWEWTQDELRDWN